MNDNPKPQRTARRTGWTALPTPPMPPAPHEGANEALQQSLDRRW